MAAAAADGRTWRQASLDGRTRGSHPLRRRDAPCPIPHEASSAGLRAQALVTAAGGCGHQRLRRVEVVVARTNERLATRS